MGVCLQRGWIGLFLLIPLLAACRLDAPATPVVAPSPSPSAAPAATVAPTTVSPTLAATAVITASSVITLTIWTTEDLAPGTSKGGRVLRAQLDAWSRAQPNLRTQFILKKPTGKGGLLDYLVNTQAVAPVLLPDLIALDSRELDIAAQTGLLQPLDSELPAGAMADLFPAARKLSTWQGNWLFLPISIDAEHLAYNTARLKKPPRTWDELVIGSGNWLFPADGTDGFLLQYLAIGGKLVDGTGAPILSTDPMIQVLTLFRRARDSGVIPDASLALKSVDEVWPMFLAGQSSMAQVSATLFISEREKVATAGFAPVPTRDGQMATLVSSWGYAVVTANPARRRAALDLLTWLSATNREAEWAQAAGRLPARRTAFATAIGPADYAQFLRDLLDQGYAFPPNAQIDRQAEAIRSAATTVLRGQATPNEAAIRAVNSIR